MGTVIASSAARRRARHAPRWSTSTPQRGRDAVKHQQQRAACSSPRPASAAARRRTATCTFLKFSETRHEYFRPRLPPPGREDDPCIGRRFRGCVLPQYRSGVQLETDWAQSNGQSPRVKPSACLAATAASRLGIGQSFRNNRPSVPDALAVNKTTCSLPVSSQRSVRVLHAIHPQNSRSIFYRSSAGCPKHTCTGANRMKTPKK